MPAALAARWLASGVVREVLVATVGGETDPRPAGGESFRVIPCARAGRGSQMNAGARAARGDVFLFHHADTELTDAHLRALDAAVRSDPGLGGGAFRRRFDERHPHLRWLEGWEALRCRRFGPLFGDQSLFVRREVFERLGGFADVPLMEDVEFSRRLRRAARVALLTPAIRSSARKHLRQGRWRTTLTNAAFLLGHTLGVSPRRLHHWYYRGSD